MMRRSTFRAVALLATLLSSCSAAQRAQKTPTDVYFVSYDGSRQLILQNATTDSGNYAFLVGAPLLTTPPVGSDLGGLWSRCDGGETKCIKLGTLVIAAPCDIARRTSWSAAGSSFRVTAVIKSANERRWLIEAEQAGDKYVHFSYSPKQGIESITFRETWSPEGVGKTYFPENDALLMACAD